MKVGVEEVKDAKAPVPIPTDEAILVGQTLNIFLAQLTHLVKLLSEQVFYSDYMLLFSIDLFTVIKLCYFTMFDK